MRTRSPGTTAAALLAAVVLAACGTATGGAAPRTIQPGAPGEPGRVLPAGAAAQGEHRHGAADVAFVRGMIAHHEQALAMAALVPTRSSREDVRLLAERIRISQRDEIRMMRSWLEARGEALPAPGAAHSHPSHGEGAGASHSGMPGMLSEAEMARLAGATGADFDRLLLLSMIRHHEGAVAMVEALFTRAGAGQDGEVFQLASEIAGDQRIEIDRMRRMLGR